MIIGIDLMHKLGLLFDLTQGRIYWDNVWINIQDNDCFRIGDVDEFEFFFLYMTQKQLKQKGSKELCTLNIPQQAWRNKYKNVLCLILSKKEFYSKY